MCRIGILFDIDELESGLYGYTAYRIFFEAIDTRQLADCLLRDGDTNATLQGDANHYCIAVESNDPSKIVAVKNELIKSDAKGLLPPTTRFIEGDLVGREPLVLAAHINAAGDLIGCQTGWVLQAWRESQERRKSEMGIFDKLFGKKSKDLDVKEKNRQTTKKDTEKMSTFAPWTSGGVCDVCNESLRKDAAYKIPVDVFYSSPKYKDWFNRNQMSMLRTTYGIPSDITVDMVLADMRSKDSTQYSAVCDKCVKLFLFGKSREPENTKATNKNINVKVDALIFKLKDPDTVVRESSVREMIALGKPAVEPLVQYLQHPDKWARIMAAAALGKIGDSRAIKPLNQALNDSDEGVRHMVQTALQELTSGKGDKKYSIIQELQNLKVKIHKLPEQYPAKGLTVGPGAIQAKQQIPLICKNIDEAIRALNTGLDPYNRSITKLQISNGLKRLVNDTRNPKFLGLVNLGVLSIEGIQVLENCLNELEQIANRIS